MKLSELTFKPYILPHWEQYRFDIHGYKIDVFRHEDHKQYQIMAQRYGKFIKHSTDTIDAIEAQCLLNDYLSGNFPEPPQDT